MKAIQLPEYIFTLVAGRQLMIRTTTPHFIAEVVTYQSLDEMLHAVGLLHTEHIPYFINTKQNVAIIFAGAMGKVPLIPTLQQQIRETVYAMAEYYLQQN